jgi:hypothetical protein
MSFASIYALGAGGRTIDFEGSVECSSSSPQGGDSAYSMTGSSQERDSDDDGIPDSGYRRASNSNHRWYKEFK